MATKKHRVHVIDDDESFCLVIKQMLTDLGYKADYTTSSQGALKRLKETKPDIILLDIRMPGTDGLKLLAQILARWAKIPIVMITAHADLKTAQKAMRLGAYDYIAKPVSQESLRTILAEYLS